MDSAGPQGLLLDIASIAEQAGRAIQAIVARPLDVTRKEDASPVTNADIAAHALIDAALKALTPGVQVISEEGDVGQAAQEVFWCVDPLDGTRSVVRGVGEYTVNIARVEKRVATLGVIYCPKDGVCYAGEMGVGAWKKEEGKAWQAIRVSGKRDGVLRAILGSREVSGRMKELLSSMNAEQAMHMSSARKFGVMAEGVVDVYPRFMQTYEWDTAAGQAIVEAAGGYMTTIEGEPFRYGKLGFLNGGFICKAF